MRTVLLVTILISSVATKAQMPLPVTFMDYTRQITVGNNPHSFGSATDKKWFFTTYSGIQTGLTFFNGGSCNLSGCANGLAIKPQVKQKLLCICRHIRGARLYKLQSFVSFFRRPPCVSKQRAFQFRKFWRILGCIAGTDVCK